MNFKVNSKRSIMLKDGVLGNGPVVYWMSRDQRADDNWALLFALEQANTLKRAVIVIFTLYFDYPGANKRHFSFMLKGLQQTANQLNTYNISFEILIGEPVQNLSNWLKQHHAAMLISDFDPLRHKQQWKKELALSINCPHYDVDAHNIVPCFYVSQKKEVGAYTLRPKINKLLPEFLESFPELEKQQLRYPSKSINWDLLLAQIPHNSEVPEIENIESGSKSAWEKFNFFINNKILNYNALRNNPNEDVQSELSPYLHFGQISSQQMAYKIVKQFVNDESANNFLEQLIVRKELSDNFCLYNPDYDNFEGFPDWAKKSLLKHQSDERSYDYSAEIFEKAQTHDELWNSAQKQMVRTGKMHGYMRMYWAKKILEWTKNPAEAMRIAVMLNDKYSLDGRDPNGYVGCAWAIGGVHDRPWFEREIFGYIRYMNYNGCKSKFDVNRYIAHNQ
jgi:deoxyribodipyrimidine photo-lyase